MFKKTLLLIATIGVINFLAWMLVSQIFSVMFTSVALEYQNPYLFRANSDPLMLLFFAYPFLMAAVLAWLWGKTKNVFSNNGIKFGFAYWVVATVPGMFATYTSMPYSFLVVLSWTISGLIQAIIAGLILSKFDKN
ncbi:MAG TPA: hypothetical protein PLF16_00375 [Candidatus Staskawiczbacteria bacterium]|nr:hypothetical protein [Candidatus Staskawiczbacteria bacterium]